MPELQPPVLRSERRCGDAAGPPAWSRPPRPETRGLASQSVTPQAERLAPASLGAGLARALALGGKARVRWGLI